MSGLRGLLHYFGLADAGAADAEPERPLSARTIALSAVLRVVLFGGFWLLIDHDLGAALIRGCAFAVVLGAIDVAHRRRPPAAGPGGLSKDPADFR